MATTPSRAGPTRADHHRGESLPAAAGERSTRRPRRRLSGPNAAGAAASPTEIAQRRGRAGAAGGGGPPPGLRGDVAAASAERLRNPAVMADPWHLISDLLEFRGRLRAGIGELIFQVASRVGEDERAQVVPGYQADLDAAVLVRAAATNLSYLFRGHNRRIAAAADDKVHAALQRCAQGSGGLGEDPRARRRCELADKRIFVESQGREARTRFAGQPGRGARDPPGGRGPGPLSRLCSVISRRENLRACTIAPSVAGAGRMIESGWQTRPRARSDWCAARLQLSGSSVGAVVVALWLRRDPQRLDSPGCAYQRHFPGRVARRLGAGK